MSHINKPYICYVPVNIALNTEYIQFNCFSADSKFATSQWEKALLCNHVSHWLDESLESAPVLLCGLVWHTALWK